MTATIRKVHINRRADMADSVTKAWQDRAPFDANGTLTGEYATGDVWPLGRLDPQERLVLAHARQMAGEAKSPLFVVWSYQTPIAWSYDNAEGQRIDYRVSQRFSVTTSKHMGRLY